MCKKVTAALSEVGAALTERASSSSSSPPQPRTWYCLQVRPLCHATPHWAHTRCAQYGQSSGVSARLSSAMSSWEQRGLGQNRRAPSPTAASASICRRQGVQETTIRLILGAARVTLRSPVKALQQANQPHLAQRRLLVRREHKPALGGRDGRLAVRQRARYRENSVLHLARHVLAQARQAQAVATRHEAVHQGPLILKADRAGPARFLLLLLLLWMPLLLCLQCQPCLGWLIHLFLQLRSPARQQLLMLRSASASWRFPLHLPCLIIRPFDWGRATP